MKIAPALQRWIVPVFLLGIWEIGGRTDLLPKYLSAPSWILTALAEIAVDGELFRALAPSLFHISLGFLIGILGGILWGLAAALSRKISQFIDPLVAFIFPVPKVAFLPIFLLLFGLGHFSKISMIAFSIFFPVFISSRQAILSVNKTLVWAGKNMGARQTTILRRVVLPAAAPQLFAGIRIGLAQAFIVLFATEIIGSRAGLGVLITAGDDSARFDLMFAGILMFALLGFVSDRLLMAIRRRVLRGQIIGTLEEGAR